MASRTLFKFQTFKNKNQVNLNWSIQLDAPLYQLIMIISNLFRITILKSTLYKIAKQIIILKPWLIMFKILLIKYKKREEDLKLHRKRNIFITL